MNSIDRLIEERDRLAAQVVALQRDSQTLTCVYCGKAYPPGSPTHGASVLTEHIRVCDRHPMRIVEGQRSKLRAALVALVGVDGRDDLHSMRGAILALLGVGQNKDQDKAAALSAVEVLIDTLPAEPGSKPGTDL